MSRLEFLGWMLDGVQDGPREYFAPPTVGMWGARSLFAENVAGVPHLGTEGVVLAFTLDKLAFEVELADPGAELESAAAGTLRLKTAQNRLYIRMGKGPYGLDKHRFAIGPATFGDVSWPAYRFGVAGEAVIALGGVERHFIRDHADGFGSENPLSVHLGPGTMTLNLSKRTVSLPARALTARLRNARPGPAHPTRVVELFSMPLAFSFSELAAASALDGDFATDPGAREAVYLNVPRSGARIASGLEVLGCRLHLRLEKSANSAKSLLTEAELVPATATEPLVMRLMGAWNSRNQPEEWSSTGVLPLAFRIGRSRASGSSQDAWCAAVLRPGLTALAGLKRVNGRLRVPGRLAQLPMHGAIPGAQLHLSGASSAALINSKASSSPDAGLAALEWRASKLICDQSRPWLRLSGAELHYPRPGEAYQDPSWVFSAAPGAVSGGVPAILLPAWREGGGAPLRAANAEIDGAYAAMVLNRMAGVHETGMVDASTNQGRAMPKIVALMPQDAAAETTQTLVLAKHRKTWQLEAPASAAQLAGSPISLDIAAPALKAGFEYAVCWEGAPLPSAMASFELRGWPVTLLTKLDKSVPVKVGLLNNSADRKNVLPFAIMKAGRQRGIEAILLELAAYAPSGLAAQTSQAIKDVLVDIEHTDHEVLDPSWVGLVAFSLPLDFSEFAALEQTIPLGKANSPRLSFLALGSSRSDTGGSTGNEAISAAVGWENDYNPATRPPVYQDPKTEVGLWPSKLEMRFRQGHMTAFKAVLQVEFRSFFGIGNPAGKIADNRRIEVIGSARKTDPASPASPVEFLFAANTKDPIPIYPLGPKPPAAHPGFIQGAWFRRLELTDTVLPSGKRQSQIRIDGEIELRKPDGMTLAGDFLSKIKGRRISFMNLGIDLPGMPQLDPRMLNISYPSLSFDLDLPHVDLFGKAMRMKLTQLALNWEGGFNFPGMQSLQLGAGSWDRAKPFIMFIGRLDFGSLPAMFARSLSGFSLELGLALNFDPKGASLGLGCEFFVRGFGFDGLDFDFLQFLRVKINHLALGALPQNAGEGSRLSIEGLSVKLLRYTIFNNASGGFFSLKDGGGDGFWAYFPKDDAGKFLLVFDWGFVGKNIDFSADVAKKLLVPPPLNETIGQADTDVDLGKSLSASWVDGNIRPARDAGGKGWTFAAGMSVLGGALRGRALIQDAGFAGLSLWGPELKKWFGYDFSFCGIYRRNITPGDDYFYISTTLPAVTLGTIHFTGGVVALEIYTSGDFMVDFGFPWAGVGGGREWRRTIGAIITPGQASAGFYLRKRETALAGGGKQLTVTAGFAVQWGLGAAFGGGVFKAWVRIGLYAVLEGEAVLNIDGGKVDLQKMKVSGAGGVLVEGEGSINWWVISVRVYVCASAEISLVLTWERGQPTILALRAELYVSASAEACVGGGWFKVCRSIRVRLSIPVTYQLKL